MTTYEFIKTRMEDEISIITIDNPPVNALNLKLLSELQNAVEAAEADANVRGIIITGAGNHAFSAGAEIKMLQKSKPEEAVEIVKQGHKTFNRIEAVSKPVIVAINGLTLGGGNELAMACDIRISSDRARFGQPEVQLGLIPAWGGTQRLPRLVGKAKAKELIFTGQMISAQEAYRIGLINKAVPDGEEFLAAMDILKQISVRASPVAVRSAKRAINEGLKKASVEDGLSEEITAIKEVVASEDLKEGIQAFLEKRPAKFQGK